MRFFFRRPRLRFALFTVSFTSLLCGVVLTSDQIVTRAASGRCFDDLTTCPEVKVALVLGCTPRVSGDRPNLYFTSRMEAAALLYHSGKCRYLRQW